MTERVRLSVVRAILRAACGQPPEFSGLCRYVSLGVSAVPGPVRGSEWTASRRWMLERSKEAGLSPAPAYFEPLPNTPEGFDIRIRLLSDVAEYLDQGGRL